MTGRDSLFKVAWNSTLSKTKIQKNPSTAQERSGRSWRRLNKQKFDSANACRQLNACTISARVIRSSVPRKIQFTGSRRAWLITDMNSDERSILILESSNELLPQRMRIQRCLSAKVANSQWQDPLRPSSQYHGPILVLSSFTTPTAVCVISRALNVSKQMRTEKPELDTSWMSHPLYLTTFPSQMWQHET